MICNKCGSEVKEDMQFCESCGTPIQNDTPSAQPSQEKPVTKPSKPVPDNKTPKSTAGSDDPHKKLGMLIGGIGLIIAAIIIIVAFLVVGGPKPKFPVVPDELMIKEDVTAYLDKEFAPDEDEEAENIGKILKVSSVTVLGNELPDEENDKIAEAEVEVIIENDHYQQTRQYELHYKKYSETGWRMKSLNVNDDDEWLTVAKAGVEDEIVKKQLAGTDTTIGGKYVWVNEENLGNVEITNRETDLKNGMETVYVSYEVLSDVAKCKRDAVLQYQFRDTQWQYEGMTLGTLEEISYNDGYAFDGSEIKIKADIYSNPVILPGSYGEQQVKVDESTLTNFVSQVGAYDWDSRTVNVQASFNVVKKLATLKVDANISYVYNAGGWQIDRIQYSPVVESVSIKGSWKGYYTTWSSKPSLTLKISKQDAENMLKGTFTFGPSANAPDFESGSFSVIGGIEKENLAVNIKGNEWVEQPDGFSMVDLYGMLVIDEAKITNNRNFEVTLVK